MNFLTVVFLAGVIASVVFSVVMFRSVDSELKEPTFRNKFKISLIAFFFGLAMNFILFLMMKNNYKLEVTYIQGDKIYACVTRYDLFETNHVELTAYMINGMIMCEEDISFSQWESAITKYMKGGTYGNHKRKDLE